MEKLKYRLMVLWYSFWKFIGIILFRGIAAGLASILGMFGGFLFEILLKSTILNDRVPGKLSDAKWTDWITLGIFILVFIAPYQYILNIWEGIAQSRGVSIYGKPETRQITIVDNDRI